MNLEWTYLVEMLTFFKICSNNIWAEKRYSVIRHLASVEHKKKIPSSDDAASTSAESQNDSSSFSAFIDVEIPLFKIQNKSLWSFLEKYTKQKNYM